MKGKSFYRSVSGSLSGLEVSVPIVNPGHLCREGKTSFLCEDEDWCLSNDPFFSIMLFQSNVCNIPHLGRREWRTQNTWIQENSCLCYYNVKGLSHPHPRGKGMGYVTGYAQVITGLIAVLMYHKTKVKYTQNVDPSLKSNIYCQNHSMYINHFFSKQFWSKISFRTKKQFWGKIQILNTSVWFPISFRYFVAWKNKVLVFENKNIWSVVIYSLNVPTVCYMNNNQT